MVGLDGALFFGVGRRELGSAIYRVRYAGEEDVKPATANDTGSREEQPLHILRRELGGWTKKQRRRYFESIADAVANSRGGQGYREFWGRIREAALKQTPDEERDILEATIDPSKAMSDQNQMMTLELKDGRTLSGRIVSRDEQNTRIATRLMRPTESEIVPNAMIRKWTTHPVSTMPTGLLNALNANELLALVAYLMGPAQ